MAASFAPPPVTRELLAQQQYALLKTTFPSPDLKDSKYIRHSSQPLGNEEMNGLYRPIRRVTISGLYLEFDDKDKFGLLKTYNKQEDIQELYIIGDVVIIRVPLDFPQTNLSVFARELRFEGENSVISTRPRDVGYRDPTQKDGDSGLKAGDIQLFLTKFTPASAAPRTYFVAVGGKGQDPDSGAIKVSDTVRNLKSLTREEWDSVFSSANRNVLHEEGSKGGVAFYRSDYPYPSWDDYLSKTRGTDSVSRIVYAEINNVHWQNAFHTDRSDRYIVSQLGTKDNPGQGGDALPPGKPGLGGAGGDFSIVMPRGAVFPKNYCDLSGGDSGKQNPGSDGGACGTPNPCYWLIVTGDVDGANHHFKTDLIQQQGSNGKRSGPGPAVPPTGRRGHVKTSRAGILPLLAPALLHIVLQYAKDCVANGHGERAIEVAKPYNEEAAMLFSRRRNALFELPEEKELAPYAEVLGDGLALQQACAELIDLHTQANGWIDYYGNPPGWVPNVSLETAAGVYRSILENSMQELYAAYYLEKSWNDKADKAQAIRNLVEALAKKTRLAAADLKENRDRIPGLTSDMAQLVAEMDTLRNSLKARELALRQEADYQKLKQDEKEAIAAGFKIAGAVLKALPLPEPYQAVAGGLGTVLDSTAAFIDNGGDDAAFEQLKKNVKEASADPSLLTAFDGDLDAELAGNDSSTKRLEAVADSVKRQKADIDSVYGKEVEALNEKKKAEEDFLKLKAASEKLAKGSTSSTSAEWVKIETDRLAAVQTLNRKNAELKTVQDNVALKKAELKQKKTDVTAAKAARAKQVKQTIAQVKKATDGIVTIAKAVNKLRVSPAQINERYNAILSNIRNSDPEFQRLVRQINFLSPRKDALVSEIDSLERELTVLDQTISKNLVVTTELRTQIQNSADVLDASVLTYIQSTSQDAHADLRKFLYYVVKAYEYYMVQPYKQSYLTAQKTFEDLRRVLEPLDFKAAFPDAGGVGSQETPEQLQKRLQALVEKPAPARLTQQEFELLRMVYEKPLREMGKQLSDRLMIGAGGMLETTKNVTLTGLDLKPLNDNINNSQSADSMPFSLVRLRQVEATREKQRIKNIKVTNAVCRKAGARRFPDEVIFKIVHEGKSIVRAGGKFFAFEPEAKNDKGLSIVRVTFETDAVSKAGVNAWNAPSENGEVAAIKPERLQQPTVEDQNNLLNQLLDSSKPIKLSKFRPGVFSEFTLAVEFQPTDCRVTFLELSLDVEIEMANVPAGEILVCVSNNQSLAIPITATQKDKGGMAGGLGNYMAVYGLLQLQQNPAQLMVPKAFGTYSHTGWLVDGALVTGAVPLNISSKSAYIVAQYAQTQAASA